MHKYFRQYRFIFPLFVALYVYNDLCQDFIKNEKLHTQPYSRFSNQKPFYSSVWCRGSNHTDRICHFENICYRPISQDFVFFRSAESIIDGVPVNRFNPTLADISSVEDHNKMYFSYVELPASSIFKFNVITFNDKTLILKRFNPENLMHVFHDDLLPIFYTLIERFSFLSRKKDEKIILAFADDRQFNPYSILYDSFLDFQPLYFSTFENNHLYCFLQGFIGLNKYTTWYQYGFRLPQGSLAKDYSGVSNIIQKFNSYFYTQFNISQTGHTDDYAVLLTRKENRRILNEATVASVVRKHANMTVVNVGLETHGILEIIEIVSKCKILVGMHGALLILSLFLKQGSAIIELFPYAIKAKHITPYRMISLFPDSHILYHYWENNIKSNSIPHPENSPTFGGLHHLKVTEQKRIIETEEVLPKLCCYDPEWLYFIYQDTLVDIESFAIVVENAKVDIHKFYAKGAKNHQMTTVSQNLHPADVQNLTCSFLVGHRKDGNFTFELSWNLPWNLEFFNYGNLEYEVWIQILGTEDISAYLTKKLSFTITVPNNSTKFYIWVRCHVDGHVGPFSTKPSVCLDTQL